MIHLALAGLALAAVPPAIFALVLALTGCDVFADPKGPAVLQCEHRGGTLYSGGYCEQDPRSFLKDPGDAGGGENANP